MALRIRFQRNIRIIFLIIVVLSITCWFIVRKEPLAKSSMMELTALKSKDRNPYNGAAIQDTLLLLKGTIEDTIIARRYLNRAADLIDSLEFEKALEYARYSEKLMRKLVGDDHLDMIDHWHILAVAYLKEIMHDSATIFCTKAMDLTTRRLGKNDLKMASLLQTMGQIKLHRFQDFEEALSYYKQSLFIRSREESAPKNQLLIAESYRQIGRLYEKYEDYQTSLKYFNKSLETLYNPSIIDSVFTADIYHEIGVVYRRINHIDSCRAYLEKAIHWHSLLLGAEHPSIALSYHHLGTLCQNNRLYNKALEYHHKALAIRAKHYDSDYIYNAGTYQNMGNIYGQAMGQYDRALSHLLKARSIFFNFHGPQISALIGIDLSIGEIHANKQDYKTAKYYYQQALDKQEDISGLDKPSTAPIYIKMGQLAHMQDKDEEAILFFKKAQNVHLAAGKQKGFHDLFIDIGKIHLNNGDFDKALTNFDQVLNFILSRPKIIKQSPIFIGMANCYLLLSKTYEGKNDLDRAYACVQKALDYLQCCPGNDFEGAMENIVLIEALNEKTRLEWLLFQERHAENFLYKAHQSALKALKGLEYLKSSFQSVYDRRELLNYAYTAYQNALLIQHDIHEKSDSVQYLYDAFKTLEQSKDYFFREALNETEQIRATIYPDSLLEREEMIKLKISNLRKERYQAMTELKSEREKDLVNTRFTSQIFDLEAGLDSIHALYQVLDASYSKNFDNTVIGLEEVQNRLLSEGETLLEYFVGDDLIFIYAIKKDQIRFLKVNKDFPLDEWVGEMREGVLNYNSSEDLSALSTNAKQYVNAAHLLYQHIFQPIEGFLQNSEHLIIIPDGVLNYIPFDALIKRPAQSAEDFRNHTYLLNEFNASISFSATILNELRRKEALEKPARAFAAFAPVFLGDTTLLKERHIDFSNTRSRLDSLKYNILEVKAIQKIVGGKLFLGDKATEDQFVRQAGEYKVLHLSTHAKANDNPDFSFVAFHQTPEDSVENEWLYNQEIYRLQLNTEMLVLSACETGVGELQRGEGVVSLSRGFSLAGVKSQVASLWNVNDEASRKLMEYFYRNLNKGMEKHIALKKAKLQYLENDPINAPFYWAGFIPIGDMTPITFSRAEFPLFKMLIIGIFLILLLFYLFFLQKGDFLKRKGY